MINTKEKHIKKTKIKHKYFYITITAFILLFLIISTMAIAPSFAEVGEGVAEDASQEELNKLSVGGISLISYFKNNLELFQNNDIFHSTFRVFGWTIIKFIAYLAESCEKLYNVSFGMIDFTKYSSINSFINEFKPLFIACMVLSLFALGIMLIFNAEKKPKILINICLAVLCVTCSTTVFVDLNKVTLSIKSGIDSIKVSDSNMNAYDVIGNNMYDIVNIYDKQGGLEKANFKNNRKNLPRPIMDKEKIKFVDINQTMNMEDNIFDIKGDSETILNHYLIYRGGTRNDAIIKEHYNGVAWSNLGNDYFYRYQVDMIPAILELIAITLIYIAMSYKCVRIAFELVTARLLAYLYSSELHGGMKIQKILTFIRDSYILLLITTLCIKIFYLGGVFINKYTDNNLIKALLICFLAFAVIDGPNLVEKLIGMDAGLKSSFGRMMAGYGLARGFVKSINRTGSNINQSLGRNRHEKDYNHNMDNKMNYKDNKNSKNDEKANSDNLKNKGNANDQNEKSKGNDNLLQRTHENKADSNFETSNDINHFMNNKEPVKTFENKVNDIMKEKRSDR